jgi:hypothetical protein
MLIIPEEVFINLKENYSGLSVLALGLGLLCLASLFALYAASTRVTQVVEKPVVVEREKLVNTNCIVFCGQK